MRALVMKCFICARTIESPLLEANDGDTREIFAHADCYWKNRAHRAEAVIAVMLDAREAYLKVNDDSPVKFLL